MINNGVDAKVRTKKLHRAIDLAARYGHLKTMEILHDYGLGINRFTLVCACRGSVSRNSHNGSVINYIINKCPTLDPGEFYSESDDMTYLMYAADKGNISAVNRLLKDARVRRTINKEKQRGSNSGWNAYTFAYNRSHDRYYQCVKLLEAHGARTLKTNGSSSSYNTLYAAGTISATCGGSAGCSC